MISPIIFTMYACKLQTVILILTLFYLTTQQVCNPNFNLPNIIKDQVTLSYGGGEQAFASSFFLPSMFTGTPSIAYAINSMGVSQTQSSFNFYLQIQTGPMSISFYFNAPNFVWRQVVVNYWITSRADIIVSTNTLENIGRGTKQQPITNLNFAAASIDASARQINYIVGLWTSIAGSTLDIAVTSGNISPFGASVMVSNANSGFITNITIVSVLYNPNSGQFASFGGSVVYRSLSTSHFNLFRNVVPIYYTLIGINGFLLTPQNGPNFNFNLTIVNTSILQSSSTNGLAQLSVSYLTIGQPPRTICSPCNNFISLQSCSDTCRPNTVSFTFPNGGRTCITCFQSLGQRINDVGTGCACLPGFQVVSQNQCQRIDSVPTQCTGVNVVQNGSSCVCAPGTFNISGSCGTCPSGQTYINNQCQVSTNCPPNSAFNSASNICVCNNGFVNISGTCSACQNNQFFDPVSRTCRCTGQNQVINSQGRCQCAVGFNLISGFCLQCPQGTVFNNGNCITPSGRTCQNNQVLVNGQCVCDATSITAGSLCVACAAGTFANKASNLCVSCIANCMMCLNAVTCSRCAQGFVFDFSSLSCMGNSPSTPRLVSIRSGFPVYTSQAVITDFVFNATVSIKSKPQLKKIVNPFFQDPRTLPQNVLYSQHSDRPNIIRVTLYYCGLIPMSVYKINYSFIEESLSIRETLALVYDASKGKIVYSVP